MKKRNKKLLLNRETVRKLSKEELNSRVVGGSATCAPAPGGPLPGSSGSIVTGLTTGLLALGAINVNINQY